MSTLQDIGEEVAIDMLKRSDISELAVKQAKNVYILTCSKVPFDELMQTSDERPVTTSTQSYGLDDLNPALAGIVSIRMTYNSGRVRRLRRSHVRAFEMLPYTGKGEPARYARWGKSIEFDKIPNSDTYTYRVRYWTRPNLESDPGATTLLTPPEWDELFKWETLYRVWYSLGELEKAQMLVQPAMMPRQQSPKRTIVFEPGIIPKLWNDLLTTISQKENIDENFSVNPVVRQYN